MVKQSNKMLAIPYGTRDFLPLEANEKRIIESKLARVFAGWGYDEVVTPTIEYLDTLTRGTDSDLEPHLYKLFGKLELDEGVDYHTYPIGSVLYDVESGTARPSAIVPRNNMQLVLSIGHTW